MSYNISHVLSHVGACEDGCRYVPEPFNFLGAFSIFLGTTLRSTRKHAAPAHVAPPSGLGTTAGLVSFNQGGCVIENKRLIGEVARDICSEELGNQAKGSTWHGRRGVGLGCGVCGDLGHFHLPLKGRFQNKPMKTRMKNPELDSH